jgi:hypothetical protein
MLGGDGYRRLTLALRKNGNDTPHTPEPAQALVALSRSTRRLEVSDETSARGGRRYPMVGVMPARADVLRDVNRQVKRRNEG